MTVRDRIAEARRPSIASRRREGDGIGGGIEAGGAVTIGEVGNACDGQRIAITIGVIRKQGRSSNGDGGVLGGNEATVSDSDRNLVRSHREIDRGRGGSAMAI